VTFTNAVFTGTSVIYNVSLTTAMNGKTNAQIRNSYITLTNDAVIAAFTSSPVVGTNPLSVTLTSTSLGPITNMRYAVDGKILDVATASQAFVITNVFSGSSKTIDAALTVKGLIGSNVQSRASYITLTNDAVVAVFTATPLIGSNPLPVTLTSASVGPVTNIRYVIDGKILDVATASQAFSITNNFDGTGTYTVDTAMTVTGLIGSNVQTRAAYFSLTNNAVAAAFTCSPINATNTSADIEFASTSTGPVTNCHYSFNGTTFDTMTNFIYSGWTVPSTNTVTLTVYGRIGSNVVTRADYVVVIAP